MRLAWFSPLPPARSGIADYSAELLPHLAEHLEVEPPAPGATSKCGGSASTLLLRLPEYGSFSSSREHRLLSLHDLCTFTWHPPAAGASGSAGSQAASMSVRGPEISRTIIT
ncbi:MAG TPA: hypothetical protein DD490_04405 [Acidobacteria bacterium]|nr:hypothetical protein [Acidobacteriota bacterium]